MSSLDVSGRPLLLPSLIPSISTFETPVAPESALLLQIQLQEPVSLVSAYDLKDHPQLADLAKRFRKAGVMFLDSGGYEYLRKSSYCAQEHPWTVDRFLKVAENVEAYDFAFSFDLFPNHDEPWAKFADRLDTLLDAHTSVPNDKLAPVLHLRSEDKKWGFSTEDSQRLIDQVASNRSSRIVAVTERELGLGVPERVEMVRALKDALVDGGETKLHVLGCGNPLTFGLLAGAGADICDGLEWCRTCCAPDMRLYHFQHRELMGDNVTWFNPLAEMMYQDSGKYDIKTFIWNLNKFAAYVDEIQRMPADEISDWVEQKFSIPRAA